MWCFFDESYPHGADVTCIVACLMRSKTVQKLDDILYRSQHTHYGKLHAKDLGKEIKGSNLLSNQSFAYLERHGHSKNQEVARDILDGVDQLPAGDEVRITGTAVYSQKDILKKVDRQQLTFPLVEVLKRVSVAASEMEPQQSVTLVFDERLAERDVAMSIRRFVAGVQLPNVSQFPLMSVSHVSPGVQLADLGAYILGRRAAGDLRFESWITRLKKLEWSGTVEGHHRHGIQRWNSDGNSQFTVRQDW